MFGQTTKLYWASLAERIRRFLAAVKQLTIAKLTIAFILSLMLVWTAPPRAQLLISGLPAPTPELVAAGRKRFVPRGTPTAYAKRSSFRTNS